MTGGRTVLITGGSRGIGRACVERFAAAGDRVAFLYRSREEDAAAVADATGALAVRADVSDPICVREAFAQVQAVLGDPAVLVNCAGVAHIGLLQDMTDSEWRYLTDTDLSGAFYLCRAVIPGMVRRQSGRIIQIGSMWGKVGASCEAAYSAAKAGLRGLTMALAKELGPSGITVNCVEPGLIDTEMNAALDADTRRSGASGRPPTLPPRSRSSLRPRLASSPDRFWGLMGGWRSDGEPEKHRETLLRAPRWFFTVYARTPRCVPAPG